MNERDTAMNSIASVVKRHPLVTFFVLAYTFSWLPWVLGTLVPASRPFVLYPFLGGGPLLAALVVLPITQGRAGLRALGARMIKCALDGSGTPSRWESH